MPIAYFVHTEKNKKERAFEVITWGRASVLLGHLKQKLCLKDGLTLKICSTKRNKVFALEKIYKFRVHFQIDCNQPSNFPLIFFTPIHQKYTHYHT